MHNFWFINRCPPPPPPPLPLQGEGGRSRDREGINFNPPGGRFFFELTDLDVSESFPDHQILQSNTLDQKDAPS